MTQIQRYIDQHEQLLKIAGDIAEKLHENTLKQDASRVRILLAEFAGKLKVHLAIEDKSLYPYLLTHEDETVKSTTRKFIEEMGHLYQAFSDYLEHWPGAPSIQKDAGKFIEETKEIVRALENRIDRENRELYPLVGQA